MNLNLGENSIETLSRPIFKRLTKLNFLRLQSNKIKTIPDDTFHDLRQLKEIFLGKFTFHSRYQRLNTFVFKR